MKQILIVLTYLCYFSLIGFAIYTTNSAKPLWALILAPTFLDLIVRVLEGWVKDNGDKNEKK